MVNDTAGNARNITTHYGCLTLPNVQAHAVAYLRLQQREHQASVCLRKLIIASITPKLADRLSTHADDYTVDTAAVAVPPNAPIMIEDGTTMLYSLIKLVSVETRATVAIITKKLSSLDQVMESVKSNVEDFNVAVEDLISQLNARSIEIPPMLENLFEGYACCDDLKFVEYIARKQEAYEDSTINLEYGELMKMALEKYKILVDKKMWLKKTEQEIEILALKAEVVQLMKKGSSKPTPAASGGQQKKSTGASKGDDKFAWKQVPPADGDPHDKKVNGKEYIYCPHHDTTKWVLKVNNKGIEHRTGCSKLKDSTGGSAPNGQMAAALANVMEDAGTDTHQQVPNEENP
ncbi:unknown protein [Seminavis robusta]|uniref:Uncharacterized protein n=1 Tax=Seminavis robusta TaxID=568900 RepID=A0A9N8DHY0_9STRA|nr:unknown protein [Seminavis robusta]|eukprot:Sro99_g050820.1 n/a (348) ;mRNA; r:42202-43245